MLFGDSLSDNGNGDGQLYDFQFPLAPYYNFRFSNGPVWVESLPTTALMDYAYGGAVVNQSISNNGPPSLMAQVNDYLISNQFNVTGVAQDTQYILWGGANDITVPLSNQTLTTTGVNGDLATLADGIPLLTTSLVRKLITAGATNILVISLPQWSYAPIIAQSYSPAQLQVLSNFIITINTAINSSISALGSPNLNLKFFDIISFTQTIIDNPDQFGLVDITHPCLENFEIFLHGVGGAAPIVCSNPDEFLFWDGEHPTAKIHAVYGSEMMNFLGW